MRADKFLESALEDMQRKAKLRDKPEGERSMASAVAAFNALFGKELSETDGWRFMLCLKLARSAGGEFHADDYVDLAAYAGLAGESAAPEPKQPLDLSRVTAALGRWAQASGLAGDDLRPVNVFDELNNIATAELLKRGNDEVDTLRREFHSLRQSVGNHAQQGVKTSEVTTMRLMELHRKLVSLGVDPHAQQD